MWHEFLLTAGYHIPNDGKKVVGGIGECSRNFRTADQRCAEGNRVTVRVAFTLTAAKMTGLFPLAGAKGVERYG
jgi:hypothetical protein